MCSERLRFHARVEPQNCEKIPPSARGCDSRFAEKPPEHHYSPSLPTLPCPSSDPDRGVPPRSTPLPRRPVDRRRPDRGRGFPSLTRQRFTSSPPCRSPPSRSGLRALLPAKPPRVPPPCRHVARIQTSAAPRSTSSPPDVPPPHWSLSQSSTPTPALPGPDPWLQREEEKIASNLCEISKRLFLFLHQRLTKLTFATYCTEGWAAFRASSLMRSSHHQGGSSRGMNRACSHSRPAVVDCSRNLVPWIQVSRSRSLLLAVQAKAFAVAVAIGVLLHLALLAFNSFALQIFSCLPQKNESVFARKDYARAVILVASQKTLPVLVAVVEQLGGALGESGLLVIPCVASHINQIIIDSFLVNWWRQRDLQSANVTT